MRRLRSSSRPGRVCAFGPALAVALTTAAAARPFTLNDLLGQERFRGAVVSPDGRHVALEFAAPYDRAGRYGSEEETDLALGRVAVVDLEAERPRLKWLGDAPATGLTVGAFAPSGRAFTVERLRRGRTELGVARVGRSTVRWLGVAPDRRTLGRMVQWRSDHELVLLSPVRGRPPLELLAGAAAFTRTSQLWARKTEGQIPSLGLMGTGRFANLGRRPLNRLIRVDLRSGRTQAVVEGDFDDLELSPDGRAVALIGRGAEAALPQDRPLVASDSGRRGTLAVFDVDTGDPWVRIPTDDVLPGLLTWCPDDRRLLVFARADPRQDWSRGRLLGVTRDGGGAPVDLGPDRRAVVDRLAGDGRPIVHAACLGATPLAYARDLSDGRADWLAVGPEGPRVLTSALAEVPAEIAGVSPDAMILVAADAAWRVPLVGEARPLQHGSGLQAVATPSPERRLRPPLNAPPPLEQVSLSETDTRGARVRRLGAPKALGLRQDAQIVTVSDHGVLTWSANARGVGTLRLERNGGVTPLAVVNRRLASVDTVQPQPLSHQSRDGGVRRDWLYLPPSTGGQARPPLVVLPYPGADYPAAPFQGRADTPSLISAPQLLIAHGYAVLIPSLARRPADRGGEGIVEEITAATEAAVASGHIDPRRVALWGHSFGGYAVLLAATRSDRFCAVVAEAAPSDLVSARGATIPTWRAWPESRPSVMFLQGWSEGGQVQLPAAPGIEAAGALSSSPAVHAGRVRAPLLLIQGDQDFVALGQAEEMFWALRRVNRDAILATFWGEEHDVESPANVRALYALAFEFLDRAFGLAERPSLATRPLRRPSGDGGRSEVVRSRSAKMLANPQPPRLARNVTRRGPHSTAP